MSRKEQGNCSWFGPEKKAGWERETHSADVGKGCGQRGKEPEQEALDWNGCKSNETCRGEQRPKEKLRNYEYLQRLLWGVWPWGRRVPGLVSSPMSLISYYFCGDNKPPSRKDQKAANSDRLLLEQLSWAAVNKYELFQQDGIERIVILFLNNLA